MFARRKREPQDDAPLVPHGLIWHATAEPASQKKVETLGPASPGHSSKEANLVEITPRFSKPQPPSEPPIPQKPVSSPPPLSWRPPGASNAINVQPTILKRVSPPWEPVSARPKRSESAPIRSNGDNGPSHGTVEKEKQNRTAPTPKPKATTAGLESLSRSISRWRGHSLKGWQTTTSAWGRLQEQCLRVSKSVNLKQPIEHAEKLASAIVRAGTTRARNYGESTMTVFRNCVGRLIYLAKSGKVASSARAISVAELSAPAIEGGRSRVRIRLAGFPLRARLLLTRRISQWKLNQRALSDSRLWTSMTMAAISALIALGIVSMVRHYASESLPSRILTTNPTATSRAPESAPPPARPAAANIVVQPKTERPKLRQAKPPSLSTKSAARPKPHPNDEEDYVAPDTYKYYGNSKPSR